jgi:hypothetical protein
MRGKSAKKLKKLALAITSVNKFENLNRVYKRLKKVHKGNKKQI